MALFYAYPGSLKGGTFTSPTVLLEMIAKYITNKETNLKIHIITKDNQDSCEIRELVCLNFKKKSWQNTLKGLIDLHSM